MNKSIIPYQDLKQSAYKAFDYLDVSENTKKDYQARIKPFLKFIRAKGFNNNTYLEYKNFLKEKNKYSISSKNKYLVSAKILLQELSRQGAIPDITKNIKGFTQDKKHKKQGLSDEEIHKLITHLNTLENSSSNARIKAIMGLLIFQGLRQVEITRLLVSDIELVNKQAFVLGKGADDKTPIDLHPSTVSLLDNYLKVTNLKSGYLFPSRLKNKPLTTRAIRMLVKSVLLELGIDKTTHGFRHFFTSKLVENYKGDLLEVQRYTRHKSLEMLTVYNDNIKRKADLPRFYQTFGGLNF